MAPSIEETACAVAALATVPRAPETAAAVVRGVAWLAAATAEGRKFPAAPVGLYFAKLWYSEALYPLLLSAAALEAAAVAREDATAGEDA